jgi:hypothetical protein
VKRIDYVYWRLSSDGAPSPLSVTPTTCEVLGQDPTPRTMNYHSREGLGMLDADSPVWASDHRAVMATMRITAARD